MIAPTQQLPAAPTRELPDHISPSAAKSYLSFSLRFFFERKGVKKKKGVSR